jgi:hypothetical protein
MCLINNHFVFVIQYFLFFGKKIGVQSKPNRTIEQKILLIGIRFRNERGAIFFCGKSILCCIIRKQEF